jgi:hypothetical protein
MSGNTRQRFSSDTSYIDDRFPGQIKTKKYNNSSNPGKQKSMFEKAGDNPLWSIFLTIIVAACIIISIIAFVNYIKNKPALSMFYVEEDNNVSQYIRKL